MDDSAWTYAEIVLGGQGWHFYNIFFSVFYNLGLHAWAFAFVMGKIYFDFRSQGFALAAIEEIKVYLFRTASFLIVVIFFWVPTNVFTYSTQKLIDSERFEHISVPFENLEGDYPTPLGIGAVHVLLKGIGSQLAGNSYLDMRATQAFVTQNLMKIESKQTREEAANFIEACYRPALITLSRTKKYNENYNGLPAYIGDEEFFQPGLYKQCHQTEFDAGGCYGEARRMPVEVSQRHSIQSRHLSQSADDSFYYTLTPSCYTWWTGNEDHYYDISGIPSDYVPLREQLLAEAKNQFNVPRVSKSAEDEYIKRLIYNSDLINFSYGSKQSSGDWDLSKIGETLSGWVKTAISSAFAKVFEIGLAFALEALQFAIPIIHGFLVFAFLAFASLSIPLAGFSLSYTFKMMVHFLYIMTLPVVWIIAGLLNDGLLQLFYPRSFEDGVDVFLTANVNTGMQTTIMSIVAGLSYIWLPIYLRGIFSSLGDSISDATESLVNDARKSGSVKKIK